MIQSITLSGVATYKNEVSISPSKINFFYGGNGTGKSTLAKYITAQNAARHSIVHKDGSGAEHIITYNRDFIQRNFSAETGLPGIFTLGQESVETRQEISKLHESIALLKKEIETYNSSIESKNQQIDVTNGSIKETCWDIQRKYGKEFSDALVGFRGDADKFKQQCVRILTENPTISIPDIDKLRLRYTAAYRKDVEPMELYQLLPTESLFALHADDIIKKVITGRTDTPFGTFIDYLKAANWIKQGESFARAAKGKCPYCQRDLPENIQKEIEAFFDESYQNDCSLLNSYAQAYNDATMQITTIINDVLSKRVPTFDYSSIEKLQAQIIQALEHNVIQIQKKVESPSVVIQLEDVFSLIEKINQQVSLMNDKIAENNKIIEDQKKARPLCQDEIWLFFAGMVQGEVRPNLKSITGYNAGLSNLESKKRSVEEKIRKLEATIAEKEASLTSVEPTVRAINSLLYSFGFTGFSIEANPARQGTYRIIRGDKTDASKTLSEGEYTFITFLYYYHLCFGSHTEAGITQDKILVIDDPISSLDSTVLFVVATLVKDIIYKCRKNLNGITQLFILTHNVHFHKEITYLGSRDHFSPDEVRFYIIRKNGEESSIDLYAHNPIKTSYELLWDDIKNPNRVSPEGILNTMRRILEHYFQVIGGIDYEKCISEFAGEEKVICKSLVAFINDGSHSIFDDIMLSLDDSSVQKYLRVFELIFTRLNHKEHYDMMMART